MISLEDRKFALRQSGFDEWYETNKVTLFRGKQSSTAVYLKNKTTALHIVVPPHVHSIAQKLTNDSGLRPPRGYHNSNMLEFPARVHTGQGETRFGYTIQFHDLGQMTRFAEQLDATASRGAAT